MSATTVDISGFNRGMTGFVDQLGISGPVVLKKEMGELVKTLVKVTPPKDPAKTRESIANNVSGKLFAVDTNTERGYSMKEGEAGQNGAVTWYASNSNYLFGVAADKDLRKAGLSEVESLYYSLKTIGRGDSRRLRQVLPFLHRRGHQKVALLQNVLTTKAQVAALKSKIQKNVGRLKAGWLASWDFLKPGGGNQPPQWVLRHKTGAKGYFISGLGVKNFPTFTIANYALGVGNPKLNLNWIVQNALNIRAKAMKQNLTLFMRGKKHLSDYAR